MKATPTAPAWCWPGRLCWFVLYGPLATHSYGRSSSSRVLAVCQTRVLARGRDGRASAENLRERDDAVVLGARRDGLRDHRSHTHPDRARARTPGPPLRQKVSSSIDEARATTMSFAKNFANRDAWRRFPMLAYSSGVRHSGGAAAPRRAASARPRSRRPPRAGAAGRAWARGRDSCAPGAPIECARARGRSGGGGGGPRARRPTARTRFASRHVDDRARPRPPPSAFSSRTWPSTNWS